MDPAAAVHSLQEALRDWVRPEGLFIRGTCRCEECEEHNRTLASHTPETMSMDDFGNAGWDPICMASDAAFLYFLPGMFRLAFADGFYIYQLLFHLGLPDRLACFTASQAKAIAAALRLWAQLHVNDVEEDCYRRDMNAVLSRLDEICNPLSAR
jgi:hypothetical protein